MFFGKSSVSIKERKVVEGGSFSGIFAGAWLALPKRRTGLLFCGIGAHRDIMAGLEACHGNVLEKLYLFLRERSFGNEMDVSLFFKMFCVENSFHLLPERFRVALLFFVDNDQVKDDTFKEVIQVCLNKISYSRNVVGVTSGNYDNGEIS
jgi:hypothetical protein